MKSVEVRHNEFWRDMLLHFATFQQVLRAQVCFLIGSRGLTSSNQGFLGVNPNLLLRGGVSL